MESVSSLLAFVYVVLIILNIAFFIKIWRACTAIEKMEARLGDMSYRDTARFIAEVEHKKISAGNQKEALESYN